MAKRHVQTSFYNFPPELVLEVLIDPDFQVAREKVHGNPAAFVREISRTDTRLVYEVHTTEYVKGVTGIDKSKTEQTVCTYDWDLARAKCTWEYKGSHANRVRVWGNIEVVGARGGTEVPSDFNVNVSIPLVGGKVEKVVITEAAKGWERWENTIKEFCTKKS